MSLTRQQMARLGASARALASDEDGNETVQTILIVGFAFAILVMIWKFAVGDPNSSNQTSIFGWVTSVLQKIVQVTSDAFKLVGA